MKKGECEEKGRDAQLGKRKMEPGTELKKKNILHGRESQLETGNGVKLSPC